MTSSVKIKSKKTAPRGLGAILKNFYLPIALMSFLANTCLGSDYTSEIDEIPEINKKKKLKKIRILTPEVLSAKLEIQNKKMVAKHSAEAVPEVASFLPDLPDGVAGVNVDEKRRDVSNSSKELAESIQKEQKESGGMG